MQCVFLINETNMEIDEEGHMDSTEDGREREREMGIRWCVTHYSHKICMVVSTFSQIPLKERNYSSQNRLFLEEQEQSVR